MHIHCNPRVVFHGNQLVSKGWMKTDHRVLQKIYLIWYNFCILRKSFSRQFEVNQLSFRWSSSSQGKIHLFLIWNDEKWLSLKKNFWKIHHHSQSFSQYYRSFVFSTSINIREASFSVQKFLNWRIEKYLKNTLIRYMHLFLICLGNMSRGL